MRCARHAILALAFALARWAHATDTLPVASGDGGSLVAASGPIIWNEGFFGPCRGDCAAAAYAGRELRTEMTHVLGLHRPVAPWDTKWGNAGIAGGVFSRRLLTLWDNLHVEPEFGLAKRFGDMEAAEVWVAIGFRWSAFPWNKFVYTTVAFIEGANLATRIEREERRENTPSHTGSMLLNYFSPEITFALPDVSEYELVVRYHHRSGAFGLINDVQGGAQAIAVGFRLHF